MIVFILPALLAGIAIALLAGPLGSFVIWRKMSYFGDTLAHASLLGVAIGLIFAINIHVALIATCVGIAIILVILQEQKNIATDTILGVLAHTSLSLGLVAISFFKDVRIDLMSYLFGDLLAVTYSDLIWIYIGTFCILACLYYFWQPLLSMTVNPELAQVEGVNVSKMRLLLMILVGIVIAVAMQYVGALIITSMLIIPAAAARKFSSSPESMALNATIIGIFSIALGMLSSCYYDTPTGPSIVVASALIFYTIQLIPKKN